MKPRNTVFVLLKIEPKCLKMQDQCSTTELRPQHRGRRSFDDSNQSSRNWVMDALWACHAMLLHASFLIVYTTFSIGVWALLIFASSCHWQGDAPPQQLWYLGWHREGNVFFFYSCEHRISCWSSTHHRDIFPEVLTEVSCWGEPDRETKTQK